MEISITKISQLAIDHSYYCSQSNFYSRDAGIRFENWQSFFDEWGASDLDYNLFFRWDVKAYDQETGRIGYYMELFVVGQRQGTFTPIRIDTVSDDDVKSIIEFLKQRFEYIIELWQPLLVG